TLNNRALGGSPANGLYGSLRGRRGGRNLAGDLLAGLARRRLDRRGEDDSSGGLGHARLACRLGLDSNGLHDRLSFRRGCRSGLRLRFRGCDRRQSFGSDLDFVGHRRSNPWLSASESIAYPMLQCTNALSATSLSTIFVQCNINVGNDASPLFRLYIAPGRILQGPVTPAAGSALACGGHVVRAQAPDPVTPVRPPGSGMLRGPGDEGIEIGPLVGVGPVLVLVGGRRVHHPGNVA